MAIRARRLLKASGVALAVLALVALLMAHMALIRAGGYRESGTDFDTFYASAQHVLAGEDPYLLLPGRGFLDDQIKDRRPPTRVSAPILSNLNPPFFVAVSAPLAALPHSHAFIVLQGLTLLSLVVAVPLIVQGVERETGRSRVWLYPLLLILLLAYPPTMASVAYGQLGALLVLPMALAWWAWTRGRDRVTGIVLGFAASVKLFCGLFLVSLLVARMWRGLAAFIATLLVLALVGLIVLGADAYGTFLGTLGVVGWMDDPRNGSLAGVSARLHIPKALELTAGLGILALLVAAVQKGRADRAGSGGLIVGATACAMLLLSPLAWHYYLPVLVVPAVAVWYHGGWTGRVLVIAALGLTSIRPPFPHPGTESRTDPAPVDPTPLAWLEPRFLGLLLVFVLACWILLRGRGDGSLPTPLPNKPVVGRAEVYSSPKGPRTCYSSRMAMIASTFTAMAGIEPKLPLRASRRGIQVPVDSK